LDIRQPQLASEALALRVCDLAMISSRLIELGVKGTDIFGRPAAGAGSSGGLRDMRCI